MKKILVPIDFSPTSEHASKLAARIAKLADSEVHILNMIEVPTGVIDMTSGSSFSIPESMLYIRKVRDNMLTFKERIFSEVENVLHAIRFQSPIDGILSYSEKIEADMIIMGSRGHSRIQELLIGSNTEKVVRNSKIPVLVVKEDNENFIPRNIVFASSFKEGKDEALKKLLKLSKQFNNTIHLLKVNTPQNFENTNDCRNRIENFVKHLDIPNYTVNIYNDENIENGILNFSNEINSDMIALATHERSGLFHIFNRGITRSLAKNANRPVLTLRV